MWARACSLGWRTANPEVPKNDARKFDRGGFERASSTNLFSNGRQLIAREPRPRRQAARLLEDRSRRADAAPRAAGQCAPRARLAGSGKEKPAVPPTPR